MGALHHDRNHVETWCLHNAYYNGTENSFCPTFLTSAPKQLSKLIVGGGVGREPIPDNHCEQLVIFLVQLGPLFL